MCQPSSLTLFHPLSLSLSHARRHTQTPALLTSHPVSIHYWLLVMLSPSFPLKVEVGGLTPQPETPDTPVSPYLSSPDEVTTTWVGGGWWAWPEAWTQALTTLTQCLPQSAPLLLLLTLASDWSALANPPTHATLPIMPEQKHDLIFSFHLAPQHRHKDTSTYQSTPSPFIYIVWIITTVKRFKDHNWWSAHLTCNWLFICELFDHDMMIRISQNKQSSLLFLKKVSWLNIMFFAVCFLLLSWHWNHLSHYFSV